MCPPSALYFDSVEKHDLGRRFPTPSINRSAHRPHVNFHPDRDFGRTARPENGGMGPKVGSPTATRIIAFRQQIYNECRLHLIASPKD